MLREPRNSATSSGNRGFEGVVAVEEVKLLRRLTDSTRWRKQVSELGVLWILKVQSAGPRV
jgi:hypothetical protein